MGIFGQVTLEDIRISFEMTKDLQVMYIVTDALTGDREDFTVPQDKFFKALAIAMHNDGTPDWRADYPDAESIQGKIRWIP